MKLHNWSRSSHILDILNKWNTNEKSYRS
uniref:Uncharacterized protein n=1 Tax=Anguilla anguilla TaxID=7936 RepID=A0A0E9VRC2_ANGAN